MSFLRIAVYPDKAQGEQRMRVNAINNTARLHGVPVGATVHQLQPEAVLLPAVPHELREACGGHARRARAEVQQGRSLCRGTRLHLRAPW